MPEDYIDIGRVRSVNPAKREVRITPRAGYAGAFEEIEWVAFEPAGGERLKCRVAESRVRPNAAIVALTAGVPRDTVAELKGARVVSPAAATPAPDPFEVDAAEYDGFIVEDEQGKRLGSVVGAMVTRTHGVIEIETAPGRSVLAPVSPEVVVDVDWDGRRMVMRKFDRFVAEDGGGPELV